MKSAKVIKAQKEYEEKRKRIKERSAFIAANREKTDAMIKFLENSGHAVIPKCSVPDCATCFYLIQHFKVKDAIKKFRKKKCVRYLE